MAFNENNQKMVAEIVGTFLLVFIGAGAVAVNSLFAGSIGLVGIALAHGLALMAIIFAFGHISGAHVNPAVTISFWITKKISSIMAVKYVIAQLIGASIAGFLLLVILGLSGTGNLGLTSLSSGISFTTGILIETILTFFLVLTIFGVVVDKRGNSQFAGLAIGLVLSFDILMGGLLTGAAMNPARAFGPAIASGFWLNQLVYWIGPIFGGILAALLYENIFLKQKNN